MEIQAIVDRFELYAQKLKDLDHDPENFRERSFFQLDFEDLQTAIKEGCKFPLMLFLTPDIDKSGGMDNLSESWEGSYIILDKKVTTKAACLNKCKLISDKVFNKMLAEVEDFYQCDSLEAGGGGIGPTTDQLYGWVVQFGFSKPYNGEVNANDWEDGI
ncbi:hypothetical protein SAMN05421827_109146 [Pedobacter terrae]|uniref:Uncharacterized protein n=1 Tax=Pedobacter terrae TaxID=405671 RepID=A0A1G7W8G8_9SPHI|nr:hypothetical protein [Pedobacter terrae]SDG68252.1 hypothetical protein SAMN05421827_109146 [Pedobacter terrae]